MKALRNFLDRIEPHFEEGGKLSKLYFLYEATDTILFTPGSVTAGAPHVRDALNLKRMMTAVVVALTPTVVIALYNTGLQANLAMQQLGVAAVEGWRGDVLEALAVGVSPGRILDNVIHGALYFFPVYLITVAAGGFWEVLFSSIRRHPIAEGFLVTSLLFPLILPPDIPWWQIVAGISFGVVFGKEVFGGVGMNVLNPALTGRAFLYFAYPADISGDSAWVAVDGYSRATPLAELTDPALELSAGLADTFWGFIPGSMGETSVAACLIGAVILIGSKVGSWRIMSGCVLGMVAAAGMFNAIGSDTNAMFQVTPLVHFL
ncbi:MAG: NADH:ubiquinone reductase (Na(+)-transporting) subunit B, partial [Longimicrobiales bacterium]